MFYFFWWILGFWPKKKLDPGQFPDLTLVAVRCLCKSWRTAARYRLLSARAICFKVIGLGLQILLKCVWIGLPTVSTNGYPGGVSWCVLLGHGVTSRIDQPNILYGSLLWGQCIACPVQIRIMRSCLHNNNPFLQEHDLACCVGLCS